MTLTRLVDGVRRDMTPGEEAAHLAHQAAWKQRQEATQYRTDRRKAYQKQLGITGDQLDMIWTALENVGSTDPAIAKIAAIKSEFPKP